MKICADGLNIVSFNFF